MRLQLPSFLFPTWLLLCCGQALHAETFVVDRPGDQPDTSPGNGVCASAGGGCTLRAAIMEANALAGSDTIMLPAGEYKIERDGNAENQGATGDFDIRNGNLTIIGAGKGVTRIDAAGKDRAFEVFDRRRLTLQGVTVVKGFHLGDGGGILVHEDALLFLGGPSGDQHAGAVLTECSSERDGGGIYCERGEVTVRSGSIVSQCEAKRSGGAIYNNGGAITITGGGILDHNFADTGDGGAIWNMGSGSVVVRDGSLLTFNSTPGRGGAIANADAVNGVRLINGILRDNSGGQGGGLFNSGLALLSNASLIERNSSALGGGGLLNQATGVARIRGGPSGATVIKANYSSTSAGGIENFGELLVEGGTQFVGNSSGFGGAAIVNHATATLEGSELEPIRMANNWASNAGGCIHNTELGTLRIAYNEFEGNYSSDGGGAVFNTGDAQITFSTFINNSSGDSGGSVTNEPAVRPNGQIVQANLLLTDSRFERNSSGDSGACLANSSRATIARCEFVGRATAGSQDSGGALLNQGFQAASGTIVPGRLTLSDSTFTNNRGADSGGALVNTAIANLDGVDFIDNQSGDDGGAVVNSGELTITGGTFSSNLAGDTGGGISNHLEGTLELIDVLMQDNRAESGGAIANHGNAILRQSNLRNNRALEDGGGILNEGARLELVATRVIGNTAVGDGGGIFNADEAILTVTGASRVNGNSAGAMGGGFYNGARLTLAAEVRVLDNTAPQGGGIFNDGGVLALNNATIRSNSTDNIQHAP